MICLEMDETILAVQDIFANFNDHIKPFRNIQIIQENERYLAELKQRVINFLKKAHLWQNGPQHEPVLRRITLFIIYNTDTSANSLIESGENTSHLLNGPKIPKCVLFYCLQELSLYPYFFDFVQFAPTSVVMAYLDSELISSIEMLDTQVQRKLGLELISSMYQHFLLASSLEIMDTSTVVGLDNMEDFMTVLLLESLQVERAKLPNCKTNLEYDAYLGHLLAAFLPVTIDCLRKSLNGYVIPTSELYALYQLDDERRIGEKSRSKDLLISINNRLLSRLQVIIIAVTVRTFFNWVEEDISKTVTLQRAVGELAHELFHLITENESLDHDVKNGLKTICVKPLNVEEVAKNANIRELIENIEEVQQPDRDIWMDEFLTRGELVFGNEECLTVLLENQNLISLNGLRRLTKFLREHIGYEDIMATELFEVILAVLVNNSNNPDQVENFLDTEQPFRIIADYDVETAVYFQELTEFFNKLVNITDNGLSSPAPFIKCLCIEPERTLIKLQNYCLSDPKNVAIGLHLLKLFQGFSTSYLDDIVQSLLESLDNRSTEYKGLEPYITTLFAHGLLQPDHFVRTVLFPEILKRSRDTAQSEEIQILLNILLGVFKSESYEPSSDIRAPLIVGLGQVADQYRWDLATYTNVAERIVTISTRLIEIIGRTGDKPFEGKHKSFIVLKSQSFKELTRYWIDKIGEENDQLDFVTYLHPGQFQTDKNKQEFLCKTFTRATAYEKELLAKCTSVQPNFLEMMLSITKAISGNGKLYNGFEATFVGFIKVFKDILFETVEDPFLFLDIVAHLPVNTYTDHAFVVNNMCIQIVESTKYEPHSDKLKCKIREFPECSAKLHLLEQLNLVQ